MPPVTGVTTGVKCCQSGKLIKDSPPRLFVGGWPHRHPLPSLYPNPRLPEGKQVFGTSHSLYKQLRCSEPLLSVLGIVGTLPKSKFPYASQRPILQAWFSKDNSFWPATLTPLHSLHHWHVVDYSINCSYHCRSITVLHFSLQEGELVIPTLVSSKSYQVPI